MWWNTVKSEQRSHTGGVSTMQTILMKSRVFCGEPSHQLHQRLLLLFSGLFERIARNKFWGRKFDAKLMHLSWLELPPVSNSFETNPGDATFYLPWRKFRTSKNYQYWYHKQYTYWYLYRCCQIIMKEIQEMLIFIH